MLSNTIANSGHPVRSLSCQAKSESNPPARAAARTVSTLQDRADRNHSDDVSSIRAAVLPNSTEVRFVTNTVKAAVKRIKARAAGSLDVASVTSPPGRDAIAISQ
jgi:hypothetical protein